jgi:aminocarboxymuconate-semialdehyde decarboxylase
MSVHSRIDIHTHIIPEHLPKWTEKFGYGDFIHLDHHKTGCARMIKGDKFFREIKSNCWDAKQRLKECDEHEVTTQVLSTIPVMFNYWAKPQDGLETSRFLNDHIASMVKQYPTRFIGLGTIPMQSASLAVKELERCVKELGFAGVQIGSNINQKNLSEPELNDIWAAAQELNACVFIHPWEMMGQGEMQKYWLPWLVGMPAETSRAICSMIFGGVLQKFPRLRVAFAHGGGSFPFTIGRIEHGYNERPDLVAIDNNVNPRDYLGKIYFDSLVHDKMALEFLVKLAGEDYICMGTDYPFPLGELVPGSCIEKTDLSETQKQKLYSLNAETWLGRKTS